MTDNARDKYYQRATTWAQGEQQAMASRVRGARIAAIALGGVAVLEAFALIALVPLKTVTMVPVLVDRQTGFVEVLKPDGSRELTANQALTQSLLAQYVVARESFNITSLSADYHKVALWSAGPARADYLTLMPAANPASPLRLYRRSTMVDTWVKSVSPLGPQSALVRFETRRRDQDSRAAPPQEWAAVVGYRFSSEALTAADRWLNPLGFQVVSYHKDAEVLPPEPESPSAGAVSANAAPAASPATPPTAAAAQPVSPAIVPTGRPAPVVRRP
jgi:type IV secretion system protein VirB8